MSHIYKLLADKEKLDKLIKNAFKKIDKDQSGYLELNEIEDVLLNLSSEMLVDEPTKDEIEELVKFLDPDQNQKLDENEFRSMVKQILELMAEDNDKDYF